MASQIQLRYPADVADPDGNLALRWENTTNTPIASATDLENGQAVADIYTLAFTEAAGVVTVDITPGEGSKNPYGATGVTVTADDATENLNIVPGASIVLSSSIVTGWAAKVSFGARMTAAGATTDILNIGVIEAGNSRRCPGPITSRSRCGTTMPTNPITPETDTAAPTARAITTMAMRLSRSTAMPM